MIDPFCSNIMVELRKLAKALNVNHHMNEAVLTIEGPRFPTKSESLIFRILSAEMINMTTYLESALARERGMHHSNRGMVIDYQNWKEDSKPVS